MTIVKVKKASGRILPVIGGTRIKISQIYREHMFLHQSPAEIASAHPTLTIADVHEALAYAFRHIAEIRKELRDERVLFIRMKNEGLFQQKSQIYA